MDDIDFPVEAAGGEPMVTALVSPALRALFRRPTRTGVLSAWWGHVPFAYWIVGALRPSCIVEMGTHNGVSYSAFCDAVLQEGLDTRCFAIDTWQGDEHAGFYDESVYQDFQKFHAARYGGFSQMLRCMFDEALPYIPDGSIDLLHIDGRHGYHDVRHDFSAWRPKLSERAVVLFHDTNVREREFGVWRLWDELRSQYPGFEFLHAHGLGVLAFGKQVSAAVQAICHLQGDAAVNAVRERFALLGERWVLGWDMQARDDALAALQGELATTRTWAETAQAEVNKLFPAYAELLDANRAARSNLAQARYEVAAKTQQIAALTGTIAVPGRTLTAVEALQQEVAALQAERAALLESTTWRVAAKLRRVASLARGRKEPKLAPVIQAEALAPASQTAPATAPGKRALFISGEPHTPGNAYRVERAVDAARSLGWDADWMHAAPVGPAELAGVSLVVLWRVSWSAHVQGIVELARRNKAAVLYDVDDLMFRPELAVTDIIDGIRSQRFSEVETQAFFGSVQRALCLCDIVTCTTEELASHVRRIGRPAMVVANSFAQETVTASRAAVRQWQDCADGFLRIGYAGGSRTHQKDFRQAVGAVARILRERDDARLVAFRDPSSGEGLLLLHEFEELKGLESKIEWRNMVSLADLTAEIARFDINLAPLELNNPFCEAKSELKYFEAALVSVPTIASPVGPFVRAIAEGQTGFMAGDDGAWYAALGRLLDDKGLRRRMGRAAYHDALGRFGPHCRARALRSVLEQIEGGAVAAEGFARDLRAAAAPRPGVPHVPESDVLFRRDAQGLADVTVIVPVFNYADYVPEALQSVHAQSVEKLDLVVVDDRSTDDSVQVILDWVGPHASRFNRLLVLRHKANAGLGFARNSGFAAAESPFVLPLDADNRLRPACCATLVGRLAGSDAVFAHPAIQQFGDKSAVFGGEPYSPLRLKRGNFIDAMALVRKWAWAAAGGYDHVQYGWEDYDFWCRLAELGLYGIDVADVLADYRVHTRSMLHTMTEIRGHKLDLIADLERRHPWLDIPTEVD
jgi:glycosyltransferase involved in cell wall biosynthesis